MTAAGRMRVIRSPGSVRRQVRAWRAAGERIAFVPTMGYFHDGHLSLFRRARGRGDRVVASIFVNPAQFGPREDFRTYPRDLPRDLDLARAEGVDLCFVPEAERMYPAGHRTEVHVTGFENVLEGATRPGHFGGVALVVLKLLHLVEPDVLVLGQKDAQQAVVLEKMISDLDLPVRVVRGAIVREPDGLAMSSRNAYLSSEERRAAPVLRRALVRVERAAGEGERSATRLLGLVREEFAGEPLARLDYAAMVDARSLAPVKRLEGRVLVPVAAWLGRTRLIDNVELVAPGEGR
jgi:pantoate--beta-alanine ligase